MQEKYLSGLIKLIGLFNNIKAGDLIQAGRSRTPITSLERALINVLQNSSRNNILAALQQLESKQGAKVYRKAAFSALKGRRASA